MTEWKTIESAPKDGTRILAIEDNDIDCVYVTKWDNYMGWTIEDSEQLTCISHWMPLPEPPKKKHYCEDGSNTWECFTNLRGKLSFGLINRDKIELYVYAQEVTYCSFCGEKA